ncbi:MAG: lipopolysaccharide biosynthesis protein [Terriglobia bacterium]|jgi:PST family polysaccharide transporter
MAKKRSFLNAVKWSYTANWGQRAFSAFFTVLLAAILGPKDFGTLTVALIYVAFIQMFVEQGLGAALVQKHDLQREHLDAAFWMNLLLSAALVALSLVFSGWWAAKNHQPGLAAVISVLSLNIPIQGLTIVQEALLRRDLDFRALSIRSNAAALIGGGIGLAMAYAGFGVWSLVGQQLATSGSALLLLWGLSHWRPSLRFPVKYLKDLLAFSTSTFAAQLGVFANTQGDALLLGLFFGPLAVGLYRLGEKLMNTVLATASTPIQAVSLSEFSRHQHSPMELRQSLHTCLWMSSILTFPALAGLAATSAPLMAVMGERWNPAVDVLKLLCVLGAIYGMAQFTGPLLQAMSKPHYVAILVWVQTAVSTASLVTVAVLVKHWSVQSQLVAIALARLASTVLITVPVILFVIIYFGNISLREFFASISSGLAAAGAIVAAVMGLSASGLLAGLRPWIVLAGDTIVGGMAGLGVLVAVDVKLRNGFVTILRRALAGRGTNESKAPLVPVALGRGEETLEPAPSACDRGADSGPFPITSE